MVEIDSLISELIPLVKKYKDGSIGGDKLEEKTTDIIVLDEFDSLDDSIQDDIIVLDSWDIQELNHDDLDRIASNLKEYVRARS